MEAIKRRHLDGEAWRELLQRYEAGGESISAFCRREDLNTNSFRRWRERLGLASAVKTAAPMKAKAQPSAATPFVEVGTLGAMAPAAGRLELKLDLGGGLTMHLVRG